MCKSVLLQKSNTLFSTKSYDILAKKNSPEISPFHYYGTGQTISRQHAIAGRLVVLIAHHFIFMTILSKEYNTCINILPEGFFLA